MMKLPVLIKLLFLGLIYVNPCQAQGIGETQTKQAKENQRAYYETGVEEVLDSALVELRKNEIYFHFNLKESFDTSELQDFHWTKKAPELYFNAYLVNTTDTMVNIDRQDGSLIMIQEAIDKNGEWKPIEYWVYSGCGNSYFSPLKLEPGQYVYVPIRKYNGSFKTKIRLKLKNDDDIIYSKPFDGSIHYAQFNKETNNVHGILYNGPANYLMIEE